MADTPVEGHETAKPDATMNGDVLLEPVPREAITDTNNTSRRHTLQRRISHPSFIITLQEGSPVGEYEIQAQIGEGAMGTVYSAVHPLIGKRVAIKVLKPELCANPAQITRFNAEAKAVNKIGHPNIVDVFSLGELPDGRAYFVMEWLRGEDLRTRLARGPMPVSEACDVLDGIARALDAAHAKDIVHRDLKPDNVFLHKVDDGPIMVKLLDFGIAKLVKQGGGGLDKTNTGDMLGTPRYISPEQARGINVDHRADIYSLGVMAYEMLAARPPFHGETAMDLVVAHMQEDAPALSQFARVPKPLEHCVMRMLAKDPNKRPSLAEVRNILVDPTRRNTPASGLHPLPAPRATPRWLLAVAALVGAVAIAGTTWMIASGRRAEATPAPRRRSSSRGRRSSSRARHHRRSRPHPCSIAGKATTTTPPPELVVDPDAGAGAGAARDAAATHDAAATARPDEVTHAEADGGGTSAARERASGREAEADPATGVDGGRRHHATASSRREAMRALAVAVLLAATRLVGADPVDPQTQAKADALFEKAQAHYQAGEYQAAIELFRSGYDLVHDPIYLFNLAQSYRKVLDCVAATDYYQQYLTAAPAAPNKDKVEGWIRELSQCVEQRSAEHEAAVREQADQARRAEAEALRQKLAAILKYRDDGRSYRLAGVTTAGAGIVGLGLGIGFAAHGSSLTSQIAKDCPPTSCTWGTTQVSEDAAGHRANTIAAVGFVAGGVAVLAGAGLYYLGHTKAAIEVTPTSVAARVAF